MKLAPVNSVNIWELVFVPEIDVFNACLNFLTVCQVDKRTAVGISYKHYCQLLTILKSFVA